MTPYLPEKSNIIEFRQPVGIVYKEGAFFKIYERGKLFSDPLGVLFHILQGQHLPQLRFPAWISYQTGPPAHKRNRPMTLPLHMGKRHDRDQASHMETRCRGIKSHIACNRPVKQ